MSSPPTPPSGGGRRIAWQQSRARGQQAERALQSVHAPRAKVWFWHGICRGERRALDVASLGAHRRLCYGCHARHVQHTTASTTKNNSSNATREIFCNASSHRHQIDWLKSTRQGRQTKSGQEESLLCTERRERPVANESTLCRRLLTLGMWQASTRSRALS